MSIEILLEELGGFGKFQLLMIVILFSNKLSVGWSMLQMSFAGFIPDWYCLVANMTTPKNETLNDCSVNSSSQAGYVQVECEQYQFAGSTLTVINEWDLVCDMKWVKATVTSIQMGGVLVGALVAGQMGDVIGRKKTLYFFALEHAVVNIITAFSVSWEMFAVCRFFIGIGIGAVLVVVFPYPMEFLPMKWRPVCAILPVWATGVSFFAVAALVLKNWSHVHLACGALAFPGLLGYFYAPESLRWLAVQGKVKEAEDVVVKIASMNNKPVPSKTRKLLEEVAEEERKARQDGQKYTYIDVFRGWYTAKITLIFCFQWFSMSCVYYGISFGVSSLAGNIYLNIFLLAVVEIPPQMATFYFNNKIGRKWTSFVLLSFACVASFACLILQLCVPSEDRGTYITVLSLAAKMGVGAGWSVMQTWGTEIYPTVTRNLGYGAANTTARVGGMIAPFLINFDDMMVVSYIVIGCFLLVDSVLILVTPETKGKALADSLIVTVKCEPNEDKDVNVAKQQSEKQFSSNESTEPYSKGDNKIVPQEQTRL